MPLATMPCAKHRFGPPHAAFLASILIVLVGAAPIARAAPAATAAKAALRFVDETGARLDISADSAYRFDAMWTDFNGDGCYDAWIFGHADRETSRLWLNRCDGSNTFELAENADVQYHIATPEVPRGSGWVTLVDFNGDGKQDFWTRDADTLAARYINGTAPGAHMPHFSGKQAACSDHCVLADIVGDDSFQIVHRDRSIETLNGRRIADAAGRPGYRGAADIDGDGWIDLVDPAAGGYWHNARGTLEWRPIEGLSGTTELMLMVDFDLDGDIDILTIGNDKGQNGARLYRNDGEGRWTDVTAGSGLDATGFQDWWTGYGNIIAADLDNDGLQDIVFAAERHAPSVSVFRNLGKLRFERADLDLGVAARGSEAGKSRVSVADFDNDGRLDILKTQAVSNAGIWRNTTDTGANRWSKLRIRGEGGNTDGVGAEVRWYAAGTQRLVAHMSVQVSNQHPQTWLHTGVGANERVDIEIRWPHDGPVRRHSGIATNQEIIAYPNGCLIEHWEPGKGWPLAPPEDCASKQSTCTPVAGAAAAPRRDGPAKRFDAAREAARAAAAARGHDRQETPCVD